MAEQLAQGLRFHVQRLRWEQGDPTVVFLHGLVMDNLSSWYFTVANPVAQKARVLLYDLRGHGRSERPAGGYGVPEMVADLAEILDGSGVEAPVHLVGNSFGGLLALAFALAHPDRVASLVLVDAHLSDEGWGAEMSRTLRLSGEERDRKIAASFKDWLGRHSARKRTRLAETAERLVYGTSLVADLEASAPFADEALRRLRVPALLLYGEHSDIVARGERLARLLPGAELEILSRSSHSILWEQTEHVRDAVVRWIVRQVHGDPPEADGERGTEDGGGAGS